MEYSQSKKRLKKTPKEKIVEDHQEEDLDNQEVPVETPLNRSDDDSNDEEITTSDIVEEELISTDQDIDQGEDPSTHQQPSWEELGLCGWICNTCSNLGLIVPTPIQQLCIPQILKGKFQFLIHL